MTKIRTQLSNSLFYILLLSITQLVLVSTQDPPVFVQALRAALGLPFVLFLPGYCLMTAAFPAQSDLEGKARLALSFGLSLVLVPSMALILDALPWGITLWSVMLGNLIVILLLVWVTLLRQHTLPRKDRFEPFKQFLPGQAWRALERQYQVAYIIVALLVIAFSALAYSILALPSPADRMTEFYILGNEGMAEDYPFQLPANDPYQITVGVRNLEESQKQYRVEVQDESGIIGETAPFLLANNAVVAFLFPFTPVEIGNDVKISFFLYIDGVAAPYRALHLYTRVVPSY